MKVEGADFSGREGYDFSGKDFAIQPETGSDMSACGIRDEALQKDGALWLLMEYSTAIPSDTQLSDGDYTLELTLTDLSAGEDALICEGTWSFSIPLTVESLSPVVTIDHAEVMGEAKSSEGEIYETEKITLQNIRITATGVSFQTVDDNGVLSAAAILSDGREVQERSAGRSR